MKQFELPSKKDKLFPNEYMRDSIIAAEINGRIYILNDWLKNVSSDKDTIIAIAYSLNSNSVWTSKATMKELITYILESGYKVYQFESKEEFIRWLKL